MKTVTIRAGGVDDLSDVETVENACFLGCRRSSRRALRHGLCSPAQRIWLASVRSDDGKRCVAGVMTLHLRQHSVRIYSLAVLPAFRSLGIGRRLIRKAISGACGARVRYVSLEAERLDHRLLRWYEEMGFVIVRDLPDYYAMGHDAVQMRRMLPDRKTNSPGV